VVYGGCQVWQKSGLANVSGDRCDFADTIGSGYKVVVGYPKKVQGKGPRVYLVFQEGGLGNW